jgi:hypothetical protein
MPFALQYVASFDIMRMRVYAAVSKKSGVSNGLSILRWVIRFVHTPLNFSKLRNHPKGIIQQLDGMLLSD